MIIDTLSNAEQYFCLHPLFPKAFHHILSFDPDQISSGSYEVGGPELRSLVFNTPGLSASESISRFECHNRHIDIQCFI